MPRKRSESAQEAPKVYQPVLILPLCKCTHESYPHSHAEGSGDVPWNWDKTHKIWDKQAKHKPRVRVVNGELQIV